MRDLRANIEESHNEWLKVKWKEIINIASLKVLSELNLEQVMYWTVSVCVCVCARARVCVCARACVCVRMRACMLA